MRKLRSLLDSMAGSASESPVILALADLLSLEGNEHVGSDVVPSGPSRRHRMLEAVWKWVAALAQQQPILFLFEDVHWADPTTLELLDLLVERLRALRIFLVITYRPEFSPRWASSEHVFLVSLRRLERQESFKLASQVSPSGVLSPDLVDRILDRADGVPLFIEELTRAVLEPSPSEDQGNVLQSIPPYQLVVPTTLQELLLARLDRLGSSKSVAQLAAVIGRQFSFDLLAAVSPFSIPKLEGNLEELVRGDIIFQSEGRLHGSYMFKHALLQDAAYGTLLRSTRRELHRRIAGVLQQGFADVAERQPELVAHHCTQAGLFMEAVEFWYRAGVRATERSAEIEASAHLRAGLHLVTELTAGPESKKWELRLLLALGSPLMATKGFASSELGEAYERALDLCRQVDNPQGRFQVLYGLVNHRLQRAELQQARAHAEELLKVAEQYAAHDVRPLAMAHRAIALPLFQLGQLEASKDHLRRSLALVEEGGPKNNNFAYVHDPRTGTLGYLSRALLLTGEPDSALATARASRSHAEKVGHAQSISNSLFHVSLAHYYRREYAKVLPHTGQMATIANERAFRVYDATSMMLTGASLAHLGEVEAGLGKVERGLSAYRATGTATGLPMFMCMLANALCTAGRLEQALEFQCEALTISRTTGERWPEPELLQLRAELLLKRDGFANAIEAAEECLRHSLVEARQQNNRWFELRSATSLARLQLGRGEPLMARNELAPVLALFREGTTTADVRDAGKLLSRIIKACRSNY